MDLPAIEIRRIDPASVADRAALTEVRTETERVVNPDDEPIGPSEHASYLEHGSHPHRHRAWLASIDGVPVGDLDLCWLEDDGNRHLVGVEWCAVRASARRRGVARSLLRAALDDAAAAGRTSVMAWPVGRGDTAGAALCEQLGLRLVSADRCSRLRMEDLDRDLVARWLDEAAVRNDGYRLVQFTAPTPPQWLDATVAARTAMADMPLDDLDLAIPDRSADEVLEDEASWQRRNLISYVSLAIAPDGSGAGISDLHVNGFRPWLAEQGDTGVVAAHRGHGLGRWLKAANLAQVERAHPGIAVIETYNATTNPWMLDINVAMGFRPHAEYDIFQGDLATACARLAGT